MLCRVSHVRGFSWRVLSITVGYEAEIVSALYTDSFGEGSDYMPRFRAVLFDFDGTLADSYAAITASVNHVLSHYGHTNLAEAQVRTLVGHGLESLMQTILPDRDPGEAARLYREHHPSVMKSHTRLLAGVPEGLATLQSHGIRMGICSNKPSYFTRQLVQMFDLLPYFDVVMGPDDAGVAKPDPAMIYQSLARLDVLMDQAVYVGDMEVDIETGRNAGIETWVVPTGSTDDATLHRAGYARIFAGIPEIVREILN